MLYYFLKNSFNMTKSIIALIKSYIFLNADILRPELDNAPRAHNLQLIPLFI